MVPAHKPGGCKVGMVQMGSAEQAQAAISTLDGTVAPGGSKPMQGMKDINGPGCMCFRVRWDACWPDPNAVHRCVRTASTSELGFTPYLMQSDWLVTRRGKVLRL